ncbi:hypothetical protein AB0D42_40080 [Streptomyces sp. NPDC048304]|uniref:hypothetical protein n=1 Tax=Streptomyces sp. NPDC048304 TaxID=3154820 RepID=UPI0033C6FB0F
MHESLPVIAEAAHADPRLRGRCPFPTHGTLHFLRSAPPWSGSDPDDVPFIVYAAALDQRAVRPSV